MSISYKKIDEVYKMVLENTPCVFLDTLPQDHFNKVHIPDAVNVCVYPVTFLPQVLELVPDFKETIILYDSSQRSQAAEVAAEKMTREGYRNIFVLEGGLENWKKANYPLAGEEIGKENNPTTLLELQDGTYSLDTGGSSIQWTGRNQNTSHFGTVEAREGEFFISNSLLTGTLEVDMNSIQNTNLAGDELQPILEEHLKSDDFFFVERFKTAKLTIAGGRIVESPYLTSNNCTVRGELTLKGITSQLDFTATLTTDQEGNLLIEAHFDLDRTRWNIIYGSAKFFEFLGMHQVFDNISIQLRLRLHKQ